MPKSPRPRLLALFATIAVVAAGVLVPATTASSAVVFPGGATASVTKNIVGTGFTLTATVTPPIPATVKYQWYRVGLNDPSSVTAITNATKQTYTPVAADYPYRIMVRGTMSAPGYPAGKVDSLAKDYSIRVTAPALLPSSTIILGGQALSAVAPTIDREISNSDATGRTASSALLQRTWYLNGTAVPLEVAADFQLDDPTVVGKTLVLGYKLTNSEAGYLPYPGAKSAATPPIGNTNFTGWDNSAYVYWDITTTTFKNVLRADSGMTLPLPSGTVTKYQWFRGDAAIKNATSATYTVSSADHGHLLSVRTTTSRPKTSTVLYTTITKRSPGFDYSLYPDANPGSISGELAVGEQLGWSSDAWSTPTETGVSVDVKYQWYRDTSAIKNATDHVYTLQPSDIGAKMSVRVIVSREGGENVPWTYRTTTDEPNQKVVRGTFDAVGEDPSVELTSPGKVSAIPGGWDPAPTSFSYQWYRGEAKIAGATSKTYTLVSADRNTNVWALITVRRSGFTTVTEGTPDWYGGMFQDADTDEIVGTPQVGVPLAAKVVVYNDYGYNPLAVTRKVEWLRGTTVVGVGETYTPVAADLGKTLKIRVTATKVGYLKLVTTSPASPAVLKGDIDIVTPIAGVAMTNTTTRELTASVTPGSVGTPGTTPSYVWYRNGIAIPGQTTSKYKLVSADTGAQVTVRVTLKKTGYNTAVDALTANGNVIVPQTPTISLESGGILVASTPVFDAPGNPTVTPVYQWQRDSGGGYVDIPGENGGTYTLVGGDVGTTIRVVVSGSATYYTSAAALSGGRTI